MLKGDTMKTARRLRQTAGVAWIAAQLTGCTTWHPEAVAPEEVIERKHPAQIRIDRVDGQRMVLYRPEVRDDSLWGGTTATSRKPEKAVPLQQIRSVATAHLNAGKTAGLVLGLAAAVGAALLIALATMGGPLDNLGQ
jgi:hypothetical protein